MKRSCFILAFIIGLVLNANAQISTEGLVALYPFNDDANDASGNGHNGIINGNTPTEDRFGSSGSAYYFNGTSDFIQLPNIIPVFRGSLSYWYKTSSIIEGQILVYHTNTFDNGFGTIHDAMESHTAISSTGYNAFVIDNGSGTGFTDSIVPIELDTWYHVVLTYDTQDSARLYINGALVSTTDLSAEVGTYLPTTTYIGRPTMSTRYFHGVFDDLGIWDRILNTEEIQQLYHENGYATVTDIDGNRYNTVNIGSQTWMAENLKTTRYSDGTPIPYVNSAAAWDALTLSSSAYCWYNDDISNRDEHGALYSWAAALNGADYSDDNPSGVQGVCPEGWHLPSWAEWGDLIHFLDPDAISPYYGGGGIAGGKMKDAGTSHWLSPNIGATNESGFTALPSGARGGDGTFLEFGTGALWWSASRFGSGVYSRAMFVGTNSAGYSMYSTPGDCGVSVRCIQDTEIADEFSLDVQDVTADEGQALEVTISVSELTAADHIISYQFDIEFDNSALEYTGNDITGTLAEGGTITVNTDVPGRLSFSYMHTTALVGTGNILRLQFNSLVTDTSEVSISNAYLNSTVVDDLTNGTVIVRDITPPTAAINYNDTDIRPGDNLEITATFSEPILASNAVHMNLSGAAHLVDAEMTRQSETVYTYLYSVPNTNGVVTVNVSHGTDLWNNEVVPVPSSGESFTVAGLTPGDVDDDGNVLAYDAALTLQHSVGIDPLPAMDPLPWENWRVLTADVDGTAGITAHDAGMILQYSAGIITDFSGGGKKSAPQANISMEFLEEEIIFYAYGTLLGLNVSVENDFHILGEPIILAEDFLSALNISQSVYRFGICTSNPPANGEAILKIPFDGTGSVNINMIINDVSKTLPLNLTTGIPGFDVNEISIYPNPVADNLNISGINGETTARIYSINGQLMHTSILINSVSEINVSELPGGLYVIKVETDAETTVKRFIKR